MKFGNVQIIPTLKSIPLALNSSAMAFSTSATIFRYSADVLSCSVLFIGIVSVIFADTYFATLHELVCHENEGDGR